MNEKNIYFKVVCHLLQIITSLVCRIDFEFSIKYWRMVIYNKLFVFAFESKRPIRNSAIYNLPGSFEILKSEELSIVRLEKLHTKIL